MLHYHLSQLPSTHLWVKSHADELLNLVSAPKRHWGALAALITAEEQTAGIGRRGNRWLGARGDLLATYLFTPEVPWTPERVGFLAIAITAALKEALRDLLTDVRPALKWPNDLTVNGRKLAGALAEPLSGGRAILLSVGVNIAEKSKTRQTLESRFIALQSLDPTIQREAVIARLTPALREQLARLFDRGGGSLIHELCAEIAPGTRVSFATVAHSAKRQTGTFCGVDRRGCLLLAVKGHLTAYAAHQIFDIRFSDTQTDL